MRKIFVATLTILTAIILLAPQDSLAKSAQFRARLDAIQQAENICMKKADGITSEMRDCLGEASTKLDALLTDSYNYIRKEVKADTVFFDALKTEQLAWIKVRQAASAKVAAPYEGGSAGNLSYASAYNTILVNRVELFIYLALCVEPM